MWLKKREKNPPLSQSSFLLRDVLVGTDRDQLWVPSTLNPATSSTIQQNRESLLFPSTWNKTVWVLPKTIFYFTHIWKKSIQELPADQYIWKRLVLICYLVALYKTGQIGTLHLPLFTITDKCQKSILCIPWHPVAPLSAASLCQQSPCPRQNAGADASVRPSQLIIGALLICPTVPWAMQVNWGHCNTINYCECFCSDLEPELWWPKDTVVLSLQLLWISGCPTFFQ